MNIGSVNSNIQTSHNQPTQTQPAKPIAKEQIASDSKEELLMAVATKMGDEKKSQDNKMPASSASLTKRVETVEQVNEWLDKLNAQDKEKVLSQHLRNALKNNAEQALPMLVANSLSKGEEPAIIFLSLQKLNQDSNLSEEQHDLINRLTDEFTSEEQYVTSIKASFNIAEVTSHYFPEEELASQFRVLVGRSNYEKLNTAQILATLMESGEEQNYDKFLNAYVDSLAKDFSQDLPIPSTNVDYLIDKFSRLSEVSATMSVLTMSRQTMDRTIAKHDSLIDSPARLGSAVLDYVQNSNQESINKIATEFMGVGQDKKVFFVNRVLDMVNQLPIQIWEGDNELRNKSIDELVKYSSHNSSAILGGFSRLNKTLENII
ncbi:hypothetical protein OA92_21345 [Marinomonas sp. SBI22]|uniref:hypothetical protein n=1 Tax=unclassified Marinomonas TaxID=196814 RepID=UPI0007AF9A78|nr:MULTISPECIES: hypothetical protein [unclassified Marinomonas]KZM39141.1 hypothetical protein OA92_21345 [Marinomonas sp. SBI22]KZM39925.1 hypothetical protein OA91_21200 [Marinomonas sp. SBI8L]